jgi:hypothetical protein
MPCWLEQGFAWEPIMARTAARGSEGARASNVTAAYLAHGERGSRFSYILLLYVVGKLMFPDPRATLLQWGEYHLSWVEVLMVGAAMMAMAEQLRVSHPGIDLDGRHDGCSRARSRARGRGRPAFDARRRRNRDWVRRPQLRRQSHDWHQHRSRCRLAKRSRRVHPIRVRPRLLRQQSFGGSRARMGSASS